MSSSQLELFQMLVVLLVVREQSSHPCVILPTTTTSREVPQEMVSYPVNFPAGGEIQPDSSISHLIPSMVV